MRSVIALILAVLLFPPAAAAQPTTSDAVHALAAGDTVTALRILEPLAKADNPDPLALFFLAVLHDGEAEGLAPDPIRACALYLTAATATNPLAKQAIARADAIRRNGGLIVELCEASRAGMWREPSAIPLRPAGSPSKTSASEAIAAFMRGDFATAAKILKPLAERWPATVDEAAAFFMAALYENGLGIPQDPIRACALYVRAESGSGPFAHLSSAMTRPVRTKMTETQWSDCWMLSHIGFDHEFEPATFTLAPGYWVTLELSGKLMGVAATIAYEGRNTVGDLPLVPTQGMKFLPLKYTALDIRAVSPGRRHFIELFTWSRQPSKAEWELEWSVTEVVRDATVFVAQTTIATVAGNEPPTVTPDDLGRLAALRVNAYGEAEVAIHAGPDAGSHPIETDGERRRDLAQKQRRKEADDGVDWNQARSLTRAPSLTYADADACQALSMHGWSADRMESISIRADARALGLSTAPSVLDLAGRGRELELSVDVFERPQRSWSTCSGFHAIGDWNRKKTWKAVAGTIGFQLSPTRVRTGDARQFNVTIRIDRAELVDETGTRVQLSGPIRLTALAGRCVEGCAAEPFNPAEPPRR